MEVRIAVEIGYFLIFKRQAYIQSVKFTQVSIDICISLTDLPWYKEYILHHKVKYCVCKIPMTVEFGSTAFMVWVIQLYEEVILLHKNLVSNFFKHGGWNKAMEAGFFGSN